MGEVRQPARSQVRVRVPRRSIPSCCDDPISPGDLVEILDIAYLVPVRPSEERDGYELLGQTPHRSSVSGVAMVVASNAMINLSVDWERCVVLLFEGVTYGLLRGKIRLVASAGS